LNLLSNRLLWRGLYDFKVVQLEPIRIFKRWLCSQPKEHKMADLSQIKEHAEVIGADGVHVGTVDGVEGNRIKLTKSDSGQGGHEGHHHYIDGGLVASVHDNTVRLSANGDVALTFETEETKDI
jgi:hypothetical protein